MNQNLEVVVGSLSAAVERLTELKYELDAAMSELAKATYLGTQILHRLKKDDPPMEYSPPSCETYFIQCTRTKNIKIGRSNNSRERLKSLQSSSPTKLKILRIIEGEYSLERELHQRFAKHRTNGEWFKAAPEILEYIDTAGANVPSQNSPEGVLNV